MTSWSLWLKRKTQIQEQHVHKMLLLANERLPSISIGCLWVGADSCGASETLSGEISREAASERRGPLPVMFCLVLTCTKHLNSHWFGEGNIWEGPHQSKGSTGRSCQKPRGASAVQRRRGGGERKSGLSLCVRCATVMIRFILSSDTFETKRGLVSPCGAPGQSQIAPHWHGGDGWLQVCTELVHTFYMVIYKHAYCIYTLGCIYASIVLSIYPVWLLR